MSYLEESLKAGKTLDQVTPIDTLSYKELVEMLRTQPVTQVAKTGFSGLDDLIGGFEDERLYVLSAPTKMGKTTLAQSLMYNMSRKGIPSMIFSYEMGWQEIARKFMAMDGKQNPHEEPTDLPLYLPIDLHRGGGELQYQWLFEAIAQAKEKDGVRLVVIDHLHFLVPLKDYTNFSVIIGGIVREIKRIAVTLKIPIILIAHVGKIMDDKKPDYTNIRDSSMITQEADVVLMMYRVKNKTDKNTGKVTDDSVEESYSQQAILSVELDRVKGVTGKVKLWHNGSMFVPFDEDTHGAQLFAQQANAYVHAGKRS